MKNQDISESNVYISVIMPALNEENNISEAIINTLKAFDFFNLIGEIIVVNDGSLDRTGELVEGFIKKDSRIKLLKHTKPEGIGASFWEGVENCKGDIVIMLPGDNENDPFEIFRYCKLLESVDIVIPFFYNREIRSFFRNALSFVYRFIINTTFIVNLNYTNGTILYRRSILKDLGHRSKGFFFQTDILIRLLKNEYLFAEVPYKISKRGEGKSKAVSFPSLIQVIKGYLQLVKDIRFKKKPKINFPDDSLTKIRR